MGVSLDNSKAKLKLLIGKNVVFLYRNVSAYIVYSIGVIEMKYIGIILG